MIACVTGGRDHVVTDEESWTFVRILADRGVSLLRHGAARGVDSWCARKAASLGIATEAHPAQWSKFGKSAGPRRNRAMLEGPPPVEILIAFRGSAGTANAVATARGLGVSVVFVTPRGGAP